MSSDDGTISWRALLAETTALVGDARHARWICETATSTDADEFRTMLDDPATERSVQHLDAMVARARAGEPIQYVLGSWAFRRLDLAVDRRVLIPRPETELLVELALGVLAGLSPDRSVVDLGTGSGAVGLALADELPRVGTTVFITDVHRDALDVATSNLAGIGRAAANVRVCEGDWFDALPDGLRVEVVVSNPPYVAEGSPDLDASVEAWEPRTALMAGVDGLEAIRRIVSDAPARLVAGGHLMLEHGHDQGRSVHELMEAAGFVGVKVHRDLAGHDRVTTGRLAPR